MDHDRAQNPPHSNEASGRDSPSRADTDHQTQNDGHFGIHGVDGTDSQDSDDNFVSETYETDIDGIDPDDEDEGDDLDPDGTKGPQRPNDGLERDSDEYRQNQEEEIQPNVDGEGREDEIERPTTAGVSIGSNY